MRKLFSPMLVLLASIALAPTSAFASGSVGINDQTYSNQTLKVNSDGSINVGCTSGCSGGGGGGTVTQGTAAAASGAWPVKPTDAGGVNQQAISAGGAAKVDGSAVTQPVSAASLPLPTGAATDASLTGGNLKSTAGVELLDSGGTNKASISAAGAVKVDGSAVTQPVSGTVTTTPPSNASVNLSQVNGNTTSTGTGAQGTGSQRVVVATDTATVAGSASIPAGTNSIGTVQPGNTPNTTPWLANPSSSTATGQAVTPYYLGSSGLTTAVTPKSSAGNLYGATLYNPNSSTCFFEVFNTASVTLGTTTPVIEIPVQALSSLPLGPKDIALGNFSTAISVAATTASKGSSACASGINGTVFYQ